jgi:hypothetical protein
MMLLVDYDIGEAPSVVVKYVDPVRLNGTGDFSSSHAYSSIFIIDFSLSSISSC